MDKRTLNHLRHLARTHKCTLRALRARVEHSTIAAGVASIQGPTRKAARAEYDAAEAAHDTYQRHVRKHLRRVAARETVDMTIAYRKKRMVWRAIGCDWGGEYSGDTGRAVVLCASGESSARTVTSRGEQYSSRCTYHMTDAVHVVHASLHDIYTARSMGLPARIDGQPVLAAELVRPGIYRVRLLATVGKQVDVQTRYAANQGAGRWHVAQTERGAVTAINRALRADEAARQGIITAQQCREWGWCAAGIRAWIARRGIRRDVARRMRDGVDSRALARLIARQGGPQTSYDRRLMAAAGAMA